MWRLHPHPSVSNNRLHPHKGWQQAFEANGLSFGGAIVDHAGGRIDDQLLHLICGKEAAEVQITAEDLSLERAGVVVIAVLDCDLRDRLQLHPIDRTTDQPPPFRLQPNRDARPMYYCVSESKRRFHCFACFRVATTSCVSQLENGCFSSCAVSLAILFAYGVISWSRSESQRLQVWLEAEFVEQVRL